MAKERIINMSSDFVQIEFEQEFLKLSIRAKNCLKYSKLDNPYALHTFILDGGIIRSLRGCGSKSAQEISDFYKKIQPYFTSIPKETDRKTKEDNGLSLANELNTLKELGDWEGYLKILIKQELYINHNVPIEIKDEIIKQFPTIDQFLFVLCNDSTYLLSICNAISQASLIQTYIGIIRNILEQIPNDLFPVMIINQLSTVINGLEKHKNISTKLEAVRIYRNLAKTNLLNETLISKRCQKAYERLKNQILSKGFKYIKKKSTLPKLHKIYDYLEEQFSFIDSIELKDLEQLILLSKFPYLNNDELKFVYSFYSKYGYYPMFRILYFYITNTFCQELYLFATSHEIISNNYRGFNLSVSQESVRKAKNEYDYLRSNLSEAEICNSNNWSSYEFLFYNFLFKDNSNYDKIIELEGLQVNLFGFYSILSLVFSFLPYKIDIRKKIFDCTDRINYKDYLFVFAITNKLSNYPFEKIFHKIENIYNSVRTYDTFFTLEGLLFFDLEPTLGDNDKYLIKNFFSIFLKDMYGLNVINERVNFPSNSLNYEQIIYDIISENGAPMKIEQILFDFKKKYPDDSHGNTNFIRYIIANSEDIECIGRKSLYTLVEWNSFVGSISELLIHILNKEETPLPLTRLYDEALFLRPDTTERSILSIIYMEKGINFTLFYGDFVGLKEKTYGDCYYAIPTTFDEIIETIKKYLRENNRFPFSNSKGLEGSIYRLIHNTSKYTIQQKEYIKNKIVALDYPHNKKEFDFWENCDTLLTFIRNNNTFITKNDNKPLFDWFEFNLVNYQKLKGYFKEKFTNLCKEIMKFDEHIILDIISNHYNKSK